MLNLTLTLKVLPGNQFLLLRMWVSLNFSLVVLKGIGFLSSLELDLSCLHSSLWKSCLISCWVVGRKPGDIDFVSQRRQKKVYNKDAKLKHTKQPKFLSVLFASINLKLKILLTYVIHSFCLVMRILWFTMTVLTVDDFLYSHYPSACQCLDIKNS